MSMLGKICGGMYAINHARETARNLRAAGEWASDRLNGASASSVGTTMQNAPTTPKNTPTTASTSISHISANHAANVATGGVSVNHMGFIDWFMTDASMMTKVIIVAIVIIAVMALIMIATKIVRNVRRMFANRTR